MELEESRKVPIITFTDEHEEISNRKYIDY